MGEVIREVQGAVPPAPCVSDFVAAKLAEHVAASVRGRADAQLAMGEGAIVGQLG